MTTLELIERGVGHNCLSDAYDLGREDAERDFQNSDYWNDYLAQVIKDTKADAIEEFVSFVKNDWRITQGCVVTNETTDCFRIGSFLINLLEQFQIEYAEQLKEKNNGKE